MTVFDKRKAMRELGKFVGGILAIAAVIAIAYRPVKSFFNPPDTPLKAAVKAQDVEAVRTYLGTLGSADASAAAYSVYRAALDNLSPSDPRTTEILKLILDHNPVPASYDETSGLPRPADMEFTTRSQSSTSRESYVHSAVELATRRWSPDGVRVLLDHGLTINSLGVSDALVAAASNGCEPVITILLDAGANINGHDRHSDTPLAMARRVKNPKITQLLLSRGARDR